jgi:hypothetical protein
VLIFYAVKIDMGHGLVLTAAHVVGRWPFFTHPRVLVAGQDIGIAGVRCFASFLIVSGYRAQCFGRGSTSANAAFRIVRDRIHHEW